MRQLIFLASLLCAAGGAAETTARAYSDPAPQRYHLTQRASEIDPRTREHPEIDFVFKDKAGKPQDIENAVVDTRVAPRGRLVIWLMNYNAPLFDRLGDYGLHAIQVSYANKWFGLIPTKARDDGTSLGKIRLEATTGEDFSPLCTIPQPDGMKERAFQFVNYLTKAHPQGRWEQFLAADGAGLDWAKIIVAGSSHGATSAARFAVHQRVDRVVMLCGPRDQLESWPGFPSATPPHRFFGFSHVLDSGWTGDHYCRSWQMLGLPAFGPITDVDATAAPFGNSRRLITKFDVQGDAKRAHSSVQPGAAAGKNARGEFLHEAVWKYLFTHPVDQVGAPTPIDPECAVKLPAQTEAKK